ncbi:MBL fold metallo-hydrolase [Aquabacterium lacunae]|uniref:MBL fold metallo-hydrolase n=1 Tax=Aquabacterium lacunae TaxID=2528630 RepID=A0A4Q9GWW8_9BURK|nr:MBL fold metallo-hydrolase [Aquabacterium lacunae]TBO27697.1 MBL fold metallo-hydrolase [Aquabacterium lacunae]
MRSASPRVQSFFHAPTWTFTHVVYDQAGGHAAVIDPVLDFDPKSGRTGTASAQQVVDFIRHQQLTVQWVLETHAHADHLSSAPFVHEQVGGTVGIGHGIGQVQRTFKALFNLEAGFAVDGSQFGHQFRDGEVVPLGSLQIEVMHVPGHTPADVAYKVGDAVFVGDTLFPPDVGTARCDFPGGSARALYRSVQRLLALPPETRLFMCHDYPTTDRPVQAMNTVAEQRRANIHVHEGVSEADFVALREARDATLQMPQLILPSIQVNIRAGHLPEPEANGVRYLKVPINAL